MSLQIWIGVALMGGVGATFRFVADGWVAGRFSTKFPIGTFVVNMTGAVALGFVDGVALTGTALALVGTAMIGSYTTFSTWMLETQRLREDAEFRASMTNAVATLLVGFGAAALGHFVGAHV